MIDLFPGSKPRQGPIPWLVTFGDLLTLLLCFFIAIISTGPLSPNYQPKEYQPVSIEGSAPKDAGIKPTPAAFPGTVLAQKEVEGSSPEAVSEHLKIVETEFDSGSPELTPAGREKLSSFLGGLGVQPIARLTIETCGSRRLGGRESELLSAQARALTLARLIQTAGKQLDELRLRPVASNCGAELELNAAKLTVVPPRQCP